MEQHIKSYLILSFLLLLATISSNAQDKTKKNLRQLTPFLERTYYNFNFGLIDTPFSNQNLPTAYRFESVKNNRFSGRFLLGYKIKDNFSIQFGVMRPAKWFQFVDINGNNIEKSVWINVWSLSLKKDIQLNNKFGVFVEAGIGNMNRKGFSIDNTVVYKNAHYASFVAGIGLKYYLNNHWHFMLNSTYLPKSIKNNQPAISQATIGLLYNLKKSKAEKETIKTTKNSYYFSKRLLQIGYANSAIGFYPNQFFAMEATIGSFDSFGVPIFWVSDSRAKQTISLTYQQTVFRSKKLFSLDWGVSITGFQTEATKTKVLAFSIFPVMRFYLLRKDNYDFYTNYSIIGPTFLTKSNIDNLQTGPKITYQDFMGFGVFMGKERKLNIELRIKHFSNGNIFSKNSGVDIPVVLTIGKTF